MNNDRADGFNRAVADAPASTDETEWSVGGKTYLAVTARFDDLTMVDIYDKESGECLIQADPLGRRPSEADVRLIVERQDLYRKMEAACTPAARDAARSAELRWLIEGELYFGDIADLVSNVLDATHGFIEHPTNVHVRGTNGFEPAAMEIHVGRFDERQFAELTVLVTLPDGTPIAGYGTVDGAA